MQQRSSTSGAGATAATILLLLLLLTASTINAQNQQHQPINVVVVLVLENRSFDHMLGWMKYTNTIPAMDGLTGNECNPRSTRDPNSPTVCVSDDAVFVDPDPDHGFQSIRDQVFGTNITNTTGAVPTMSGFVENALSFSEELAGVVMKGFNPSRVPVYTALATEFAVFDRWFSGLPSSTQSNRLFLYSATSGGATSNDKWQLAKGFPQKTIFDSLNDDGLDFAVYHEMAPTVLFYRNLRKLKYVPKFHFFSTFKKHAKEGKLKSLNVIEPRYFDLGKSPANDDHPSHDVSNGQRLVKEVYESLRASPQWNESLLLITYDEHGGFYDHVPTPNVGVPSPDGITGPKPFFFEFDRLGVRVPTIAVSPWIKKGTVVNKPSGPQANSEYEHSSIPATIKKMFNLTSDFLTKRDAWAGTFEHIVGELSSPRTDCPEVLPEVTPLRTTEADETRALSEFQRELIQLASVLSGDDLSKEKEKNMTVKEGDAYVRAEVSKFFRMSREARATGADGSAIVDMKA